MARIFEVKGRPASSPIIVHVSNTQMARSSPVAPDRAVARAEVLARTADTGAEEAAFGSYRVTAGLDTVGVRMPSHPVALALIEAAQLPIAAPSANRFTQLSPTRAEHVRQGLGARVDYILDGGECAVGIESTVLSLAGGPRSCCGREESLGHRSKKRLVRSSGTDESAGGGASLAGHASSTLQSANEGAAGARRGGAAAGKRSLCAVASTAAGGAGAGADAL